MTGAGVLPVTIHNNKMYFLFGKEHNHDETPGWSDFAGGKDNNETPLKTAIREGTEELTGFLGSEKDLEKMLKKHGTYNLDWGDKYRTHIFPMVYDPALAYYYNNNQRFLQKKLPLKVFKDYKIFEKAEIKWVCIDEIPRMQKHFRSFYKNITALILENRKEIEKFIRRCLKNGKNNKTRKKY